MMKPMSLFIFLNIRISFTASWSLCRCSSFCLPEQDILDRLLKPLSLLIFLFTWPGSILDSLLKPLSLFIFLFTRTKDILDSLLKPVRLFIFLFTWIKGYPWQPPVACDAVRLSSGAPSESEKITINAPSHV